MMNIEMGQPVAIMKRGVWFASTWIKNAKGGKAILLTGNDFSLKTGWMNPYDPKDPTKIKPLEFGNFLK